MEKLAAGDPQRIGAYRLLARLGTGGMGQVFLARSDRGRTVAVKLVRKDLAERERFRSRFRQEVAAARRVGGAWTAPVLDADTEAEVPWLATGYVAGPSLHEVVSGGGSRPGANGDDAGTGTNADTGTGTGTGTGADGSSAGPSGGPSYRHGPLPERSVRILASGLAHALQDIHAAGLIHRDLKPSNVLVTIDGPRVIDFGIARALETVTEEGLTRAGDMVGSPGFMAPEQVRGDRVTAACDVFCLGSVLAYAATGRLPFGTSDSGVHALMYRITQEEPDLSQLPEGLMQLVQGCLLKDPARRPTTKDILAKLDETPDKVTGPGSEPWLPGGLLARLGQHAVQLLEYEDPTGLIRTEGTELAEAAAKPKATPQRATTDTMTLRPITAPLKRPGTPHPRTPQQMPGPVTPTPGPTTPTPAQAPPHVSPQAPPHVSPRVPPQTPSQTPPQYGYPQPGYGYPGPGSAPGYGYPQPGSGGPGSGAVPGSGYGYPGPGSGYGYPGPGPGSGQGGQGGYGYPHTGPAPLYTQPPAPEPPKGRSSKATIALIAVAVIVALGAGGSVYALMAGDSPKDDKASQGTSAPPANELAPSDSAPSPSASPSGSPSPSPSAGDGAVPSNFIGTWTGGVSTASGFSPRKLVIEQGEVGDTILILTADGPGGAKGGYHCVFDAPLASKPAPGAALQIGPSTVTTGEPMTSCTPGTPTTLTVLANGDLQRVTEAGEAVTYKKSAG
jgi:serine/threonine protein kinase